MKKITTFITLSIFALIISGGTKVYAQDITAEQYIAKYKDLAIESMQKHKIPASIKLAQGIIETSHGNSRLAVEANNHFGIKCKSSWTGAKIYHNDDAEGECFRSYNSSEDSYNDHSLFLTGSERYATLFEYEITDYKSWAKGLKAAGYATNPKYPLLLIKAIEDYSLYEIDDIALKGDRKKRVTVKKEAKKIKPIVEKESTPISKKTIAKKSTTKKKKFAWFSRSSNKVGVAMPGNKYDGPKLNVDGYVQVESSPRAIYRSNNVLFTIAKEGDTFETISVGVKTSASKLMKNNEIIGNNVKIVGGSIIYLSSKNKKSTNGFSVHTVRKGETLHFISQIYGIKMGRLAKINGMPVNYKVSVGQRVRLL